MLIIKWVQNFAHAVLSIIKEVYFDLGPTKFLADVIFICMRYVYTSTFCGNIHYFSENATSHFQFNSIKVLFNSCIAANGWIAHGNNKNGDM